MDDTHVGRLWNWYLQTEEFDASPLSREAGIWTSIERGTALVIGVSAFLIVAAVAAAVFSFEFLALSAAFGGALVLGPLAIDQSRRKSRAIQELRSAIGENESNQADLVRERMEIEARAQEVKAKADKVEKQYQILTGLVVERSPAQARTDDPYFEEREELQRSLESALAELRSRERAESTLTARVAELETARNRAEQELSRLMGESHTQLMTEREVAAAERGIEEARQQACEILEQAEEEARIRAAELQAQAEENVRAQTVELVKQAEEEALAQARDFVEQAEEEAQSQAGGLLQQAEREARTQTRELLRQARKEARAQSRELLRQAEEEATRIVARGELELETFRSKVDQGELVAEGAGDELLREALIEANELVERAGEKADRLAAQGKVEFESILREIQQQELVEKELYERIQALEARQEEAESSLLRTDSSLERQRVFAEFAAEEARDIAAPEHSNPELVLMADPPAGSVGYIRRVFAVLLNRRSPAN